MRVVVSGRELEASCGAGREQRMADLAAILDERLARIDADGEVERLALAALQLLDETQVANAALERARLEIERLTDLLVEARLAAARQVARGPRPRSAFVVQGGA